MNLFRRFRRPKHHTQELIGGRLLVSRMVNTPWVQFEWKRWKGVAILGVWVSVGNGNLPGLAFDTHGTKRGLTWVNINLPSSFAKVWTGTQWGQINRQVRPIRETQFIVRHGQWITEYEKDARGNYVKDDAGNWIPVRTYRSWEIAIHKSDHLFDWIKMWLRRKDRYRYLGTGTYPLFWKLNYRRSVNDQQPHDFDMLYWGDTCLMQDLD